MQKKLIALAVAGLVSAPVFAQSNVQIYGIMDLGFTHQGGSEEFGGHAGLKNRSAVDHSQSASSRLGFRGTEDLGNGLKAFFTVEQSLSPDTTSATGNRQAFLGLEGGFGRVWMGRDFNPSRAFWNSLDPFGATGVGSNQNVIFQQTRYDNAVFYRTPNFGGLTITGAFTNSVSGNESRRTKGSSKDFRGWSITPVYKNGPLTLGGSYERYSDEAYDVGPSSNIVGVGVDRTTRWNLGAGYDFGVADIRLGYTQSKWDDMTATGVSGDIDVKAKSWMLAGVIPVSERGKILASYAHTTLDVSGGSDPKAKQFALGYLHSLSKRTAVYATYSKVNTNSRADGFAGVHSSIGIEGIADGVVKGSKAMHTSGFAVGLRHSF